jgi:hypothetical protein
MKKSKMGKDMQSWKGDRGWGPRLAKVH